jgi:SH3-like domain-containing protein
MRLLAAALFGCCAAIPSFASGEQTFPYRTYVAADEVHVRSGPGQNYYPTSKLKRGAEVEVYRHDPGGWCAIRPVEGSFTWVSSRFLKPTEDNLAAITEDAVQARVGSQFSDIRDVVQVRLQKGEVVELFDPPPHGSARDENAGPARAENAWVKIAPPAGEFRWISSKYLDAEFPHDGVRVAPRARKDGRRSADDETADVRSGAPSVIPASASTDNDDDSFRARSSRPRSLSAQEFQAELDRIELELSMMVIEEPSAWSFNSLRSRTDSLLDQAQTAVERGRARLLASRIARFDDIKQRQDAVLALRDQTDRTSRVLTGLRPKDAGDGQSRSTKFEVDGRFDGVGQLTQVVSPKVGAPRFALVDEAGEVRYYVTAAPGVNLHNYIGRQVGVTGVRGVIPEQHISHIMARHVTPLEAPVLR